MHWSGSMRLEVQHVQLALPDVSDGALIFDGNVLVAMLSRLGDSHGSAQGGWHIEALFTDPDRPVRPVFSDLKAACHFLQNGLRSSAGGGDN